MKLISIALIFIVSIQFAYLKTVKRTFHLQAFSTDEWKQLTKFAIDIGSGKQELRAKITALEKTNTSLMIPISFSIFMDEEWAEVLSLKNCSEKIIKRRGEFTINVPVNGTWSPTQSNELSQSIRTHVWFWAITDCEKLLDDFVKKENIKHGKLEAEIIVQNADGSHFSSEEHGLILPNFIILGIAILFLAQNVKEICKSYKKENEIDWPLSILAVTIVLEVFGIFFEFIHLSGFSYNGYGIMHMNIFSNVFNILAQFLVSVILIFLAWGWTINFKTFDNNEKLMSGILFLGLIQFLIVSLGHLTDDEHSKYHDQEGLSGYLLILIKIGFFAQFLKSLLLTYTKAKPKLRVFIVRLGFMGSIYFLAFPLIVFIAKIFAPQLRHKVIVIGTLAMEMVGMMVLLYIFLAKKGIYYEVSLKSQSILPTNVAPKID